MENDKRRRRKELSPAAQSKLRQTQVMGARMLFFTVWTEELLRLIVDTNAATDEMAAVMLDHLQARLWSYNQDNPTKAFQIHPEEIEEESNRVAALAASYRKRHQDRGK